ncbi:MAG: hypothetical protein SFV15_13925 [Polyangiaceae bacterium]|nr:hypothetical protein [Polyangiaceae bacterium]
MRNTVLGLISILTAGVALPSVAFAEGEAATATATTTAETPVATTEASTTTEAAPQTAQADETPAPAPETPAPAEAAPAAEEETFPASWFRIDSDGGYLQLWAGATHPLTDSVGLASDIYVLNSFVPNPLAPQMLSLGELDVGPAITAGSFTVTPMLGVQADLGNRRLAALVPQFYLTGGPDPIYTELWIQNYAYTAFDKTGVTATGGGNSIYARWFLDYKLGKYAAVGPEVELTYALNSKSKANGESLTSLPVGVNVMLPNYGKGNTLFIFAGYETQDTANDSHFAGRLTFVRNF